MLEAICLKLKPNTSKDWVKEKLKELGFKETSTLPIYANHFCHGIENSLVVAVRSEDRLYFSRILNSISPHISVS